MLVLVSRLTSVSALLLGLLKTLQPSLVKIRCLVAWGVAVSLMLSVWISMTPMVRADTLSSGEASGELFEIHCAGCHPNGANIIRRGKSLKQKALKRYGYDSVAAIATIITNGKGLMSAYGDQLSEDEIASLAHYVLDQAAINWKPAQ